MNKIQHMLNYINALPFPLTIKHYFAFDATTKLLKDGKLDSRESWDVLRTSHPHFSISQNREEWLKAAEAQIKKDGQDGGLVKRAKDVTRVIEQLGITSVFSVGVGGAGLEYQIKKLKPGLHLTCSEYSPVAVEALQKVFTECDSIMLFDMNTDDWSIAIGGVTAEKQLCILSRIDIDVTDEQFRTMFKNMHAAGIKNILILTCVNLTLRDILGRMYHRIRGRLNGVRYVFSGFLRSEKAFINLWEPLYTHTTLTCGGLKSFLLKKSHDIQE